MKKLFVTLVGISIVVIANVQLWGCWDRQAERTRARAKWIAEHCDSIQVPE